MQGQSTNQWMAGSRYRNKDHAIEELYKTRKRSGDRADDRARGRN
jgi:hypothetical protein